MQHPPAEKPRATLLLALVVAAIVAYGFGGRGYDDGLITYRYAENLAAGRGFVFNPGDRVLGTSAPGYALALAGLTGLSSPLAVGVPWIAASLSFAALLALAALPFIALPRARSTPPGTLLVAGAALFPFLALTARWNLELIGCETLPATALVAWGATLALVRDRPIAGGLLVGLATAFRFDAALAAAAIGLALVIRRRAAPLLRFAAAAGAVVLPLVAALALYFGSFIPNTLSGKRSELVLARPGYSRAEWEWLVRGFGELGAVFLLAAAASGLALLVWAWRRRTWTPHERGWLAALGTWLFAHELFYRSVGVPFSPWYQIAPELALLGLATGATVWVARRALAGLGLARPGALVVAAAASALLLPLVTANLTFVATSWRAPADPRWGVYHDLAIWVRDHSPPEAAIATVEIGAIGFYSQRPVLDLVGLVDPRLLAAKREGRLAAAVAARAPSFIVDHPGFRDPYLAPLLARADVRRDYRLVGVFYRPDYPIGVRLLARRPGAAGPS